MDFLQTLKAQVGGLLHIKSELYWYGGRGWDGAPGRVCLLLDAALGGDRAPRRRPAARALVARAAPHSPADLAVLLLIDGCPHWVWVSQEDVELIT